uniref:Uncharacterized protein n=2 Tax=Anguilla anguilla TaxID=7936 RepID=A0A0E9T9N6_ANGAN
MYSKMYQPHFDIELLTETKSVLVVSRFKTTSDVEPGEFRCVAAFHDR